MLTDQEKATLKVLLGKHTMLGANFKDRELRIMLLIADGMTAGYVSEIERLAADIQLRVDQVGGVAFPEPFTVAERMDAGISHDFQGVPPSTPIVEEQNISASEIIGGGRDEKGRPLYSPGSETSAQEQNGDTMLKGDPLEIDWQGKTWDTSKLNDVLMLAGTLLKRAANLIAE